MRKALIAVMVFSVFGSGVFVVNAATAAGSAGPFVANLSYGMTGSAVTALQQFLATQGDYTGPVTGNFLKLTFQAVKQFQISNNISPASGYFGPLTRAKANSIVNTQAGAQTNSLTNALSAGNTTVTSTGAVAGVSSDNLLAYMQWQLNSMSQTLSGIQQRIFGGHHNSKNPPPTPTPTSTTPTSTSNPTPTPTSTPTSTVPTPPAPTSTPTSKLIWGAYVGDIDSTPSLVSTFGALVGKSPNIVATFVDLASGDFPSSEKAVVGDQGKTLLIFLEPAYSFDQLNSGAYDSVLQQYATAAASYGDPIILAPFDEFNLNENAWGYGVGGNTPAKFIQAWQHIHGFFANVPNVKFALVYNNVGVPATTANGYAAYYPGNAYVDYVAADGFNFGTTSASAQTFAQVFNPIMPTLVSFNKPILLASLGSLEFPGKAQWMTDLGSYVKQYPAIAGWVYFNYNDTAAKQDWRVNTDAASLAAFQAILP